MLMLFILSQLVQIHVYFKNISLLQHIYQYMYQLPLLLKLLCAAYWMHSYNPSLPAFLQPSGWH